MGHSARCRDLTTYWSNNHMKCVRCPLRAGYEVTPNCGFDDNGGRHELPHTKCRDNTFNDGSWAVCQSCASCPPGSHPISACNSTADTRCQESIFTTLPYGEPTSEAPVELAFSPTSQGSVVLWAVPLSILISIALAVLSACIIYRKRNRGQHRVLTYDRNSSFVNTGFAPISAPACSGLAEETLSPELLSAPLKTVLDNLDVLEELVILLDPDSSLVKNTKHLASHCSFSSTWVTYTYSMRDSKSPLKAVLEGVTSKHPDWTVGHLVKLLEHIERNDAIAVLGKLRANSEAV